jgi:hypothetical protein
VKQFTASNANKSDPISFELVGTLYTFAPTKRSSVIMALMVPGSKSELRELDRVSQLLDWFSNGLNKDHNKKHDKHVDSCQACDVQARLADEDDELDFENVLQATSWLMGEVSGSVPTS